MSFSIKVIKFLEISLINLPVFFTNQEINTVRSYTNSVKWFKHFQLRIYFDCQLISLLSL